LTKPLFVVNLDSQSGTKQGPVHPGFARPTWLGVCTHSWRYFKRRKSRV